MEPLPETLELHADPELKSGLGHRLDDGGRGVNRRWKQRRRVACMDEGARTRGRQWVQ